MDGEHDGWLTNGMPPGPFPLPVLGNLHQLGKMPHKALKKFSEKYGGLTTIFLGSVPTVLVSDPVILKELIITKSEQIIDRYNSDSAQIIGQEKNLLFAKGPYWKKYRKLFTGAMTKARTHNIASRIEQQAINLNNFFGNYAASGQPLNPHDYIRRYSLNGVIDYSFSDFVEYESETDHIVIKAAEIMEEILATGNPHDYIPFLKPFYTAKREALGNAVGQVWTYCEEAINIHRKSLNEEKPRDLLDLLLMEWDKSDEKDFYEDDGLAKCLTDLIVAGHETVAITLGWLIIFMVNNPEMQEKVYEELVQVVGKGNHPTLHHRNSTTYLNAVLKETLRIRTAAPLALPRSAVEDIEIGGYTIPKGTQVLMAVYGLAMDDNHWDSPEEFNPDRWIKETSSSDYTYIPFGLGPRMCVGMGVAKDELYYAASQMLINFKWTSCDGKPLDDEGVSRIALEYKQYQIKVSKR
ncbi:cytochrome P450 family protein [Heterostelium album PN500]|uniref:Cytochrome P450 family protein n=1 Tax=Heterostelium pallidum (strain ATCC 26659 / Pp 5 / PN500) TaxID=670386 RepID=D3BHN0_HETP5|nr:cytochrome P450 family protein [Heterostelium album PN500]EFA79207.1 cytochrome P450 family protein [Heterostelium album PN500]|eukprot:XP_020431328.1 cytochrome P450 family protein [Heterostelium album PN500]